MAFATSWLRDKAVFQEFIQELPGRNTGIILVIPAYNEPHVTMTLDSLADCDKPDCEVEVLVVINAPLKAPQEHLEGNLLTLANIESWKKAHKNCFFRLFSIKPDVTTDDWGVGLARKTGMDEALRRFNKIDKPDGVILCLDADCTVKHDYITSICNEFFLMKDRTACSVYFEHPLSGNEYPGIYYTSILSYELHLRYYYQGLILSGYPYPTQTTGSAMAVKALTYIKAGGMNRKQAGEDFYFIQKLASSDGYFYLNSTAVYPSPRSSYRVPFGTGASIEKLISSPGSDFLTYNPNAFEDLKATFLILPELYDKDDVEISGLYERLPNSIKLFIPADELKSKIDEIRRNTGSYSSFSKRFFGWFNMFKVVKYLNFIHREHIPRVPVNKAATSLLKKSGVSREFKNDYELLEFYRSLERGY
ncbi:MAG TPA: glycosyltransferase family A protein [Bacteroidales bacterium]|nr:glycosyltransferase family A protein [Bacteroidales bacterium]